ncbi:hypothetical protein A0H81_00076 [Grifola frondosa]|uniref:Uncharacterized protein n=1 Tax=Grifola frondosa TaxID=5627 RepID=A0A1C7MRH1_GRIFR|nr:hypothetical protein A0H81_00076 [Grifola frondosa]
MRAYEAPTACYHSGTSSRSLRRDLATARIISREVSSHLGTLLKRFDVLCYVLQIDLLYTSAAIETRQIYGIHMQQKRNDAKFFESIVTKNKELLTQVQTDLNMATLALQYTQSHSVVAVIRIAYLSGSMGVLIRSDIWRTDEMWHNSNMPVQLVQKCALSPFPFLRFRHIRDGIPTPTTTQIIPNYLAGLPLNLGPPYFPPPARKHLVPLIAHCRPHAPAPLLALLS